MDIRTSAADNSRRRKEKDVSITIDEFSQLLESQPRKWHIGQSKPHPQIHRVPLRMRLKGQQVYDPMMVSLGPYHHGKPEYRQAEEFKYLCLDWCSSFSEERKASLYKKILERIDEIRGCYADVSIVEKYDDKSLALMMLLDACFILNFMENPPMGKRNNSLDWVNCLGVAAAISFAARDILLLENQIPLLVLKLVMSLLYEKEESEELVRRFLSLLVRPLSVRKQGMLIDDEESPFHILEACWRIIVEEQNTPSNQQLSNSSRLLYYKLGWPKFIKNRQTKDEIMSNFTLTYCTCRSATNLKAKGVFFSPSSSRSVKDVRFISHALYGELQLPVCYFSDETQVKVSNLIAYEVSPDSKADLTLLSYANLLKSLIEGPADVQELLESGVLYKRFANNEQVVEVLKNFDTCGLVNFDIFADVKQRIEEHCSNKAKVWMANLIYTRFRSPWTVIALLASTLLFCFTFLQTFFTVRPVSKIT